MNRPLSLLLACALLAPAVLRAQQFEAVPDQPQFEGYRPLKAPVQTGPYLQTGDRLAICGDSITEQKMYSRIIETYLTVCAPELEVSVRQFGWSGERADGFLRRMENDVLRFDPTIATTCYGMNDHRYRPYTEEIGEAYRTNMHAIVRTFLDHGARVVLGSPGAIGKLPTWTNSEEFTVDQMNRSLLELRNIGVRLADELDVRFADIFWPMQQLRFIAMDHYGEDYAVAGRDGVHPGWAGQTIMAHAFLKALGVNGEIGTFVVDLDEQKAFTSQGHEILDFKDGLLRVESRRYPFCAEGADDRDDSIRSAMTLIPFNEDLNRLTLSLRNAKADNYRVTWGGTSKEYSAKALAAGVNLAAEFEVNPFSLAFKAVDDAVFRKQEYETRQIKTLFHGPEARVDMEATVELTEQAREPFVEKIKETFKPVIHEIRIEPLE